MKITLVHSNRIQTIKTEKYGRIFVLEIVTECLLPRKDIIGHFQKRIVRLFNPLICDSLGENTEWLMGRKGNTRMFPLKLERISGGSSAVRGVGLRAFCCVLPQPYFQRRCVRPWV
jgi:hypothetical protein